MNGFTNIGKDDEGNFIANCQLCGANGVLLNQDHKCPEIVKQRIVDAETRCSQWLADGNEAEEKGNELQAEKCFNKAQFWLDRANRLRGNN